MAKNLIDKAKKEFKNLFNKILTGLISLIFSGFTLSGWVKYSSSLKMAEFYGIPSYYFFEDNIYEILNKILFFLLLVFLNFLPLILKKLMDEFKLNISKLELIYYTTLITVYTFFSIYFMGIGIALIIGMKYSLLLKIFIGFIAFILTDLMGSRTYKLLYFCFIDGKIKSADEKDEPNEGYKIITFDFNGGKSLDTKKIPIKYQVLIGLKISDVIKYIREHECVNKIKKGDTKLAHWSFSKDIDEIYKNQKITEDFSNDTILYAHYSDKKFIFIKLERLFDCVKNIFKNIKNTSYEDKTHIQRDEKEPSILKKFFEEIKNAIEQLKNIYSKSSLTIILFLIFIPIFLGWIYIDFYLENPKNKVYHEFVTLDNNQEKIIVGYYKDKAILMDYEVLDEKSDENKDNWKIKNIKIIKGKFFLKSLNGEKIEIKKFKILDEEKQ